MVQIKRQFSHLSGNKSCLSKEEFIKNAGLMGIDQGRFLSEKIFMLMESEQRDNVDLESYTRFVCNIQSNSTLYKAQVSFFFFDQG